jgi:hypothetical protein
VANAGLSPVPARFTLAQINCLALDIVVDGSSAYAG